MTIKGMKNFKKVQSQYLEAKEEFHKIDRMVRNFFNENIATITNEKLIEYENSLGLSVTKDKYEKLEEVILIEGERIIKINSPEIYKSQRIDLLFKKAKEDLTIRFQVLKMVREL